MLADTQIFATVVAPDARLFTNVTEGTRLPGASVRNHYSIQPVDIFK